MDRLTKPKEFLKKLRLSDSDYRDSGMINHIADLIERYHAEQLRLGAVMCRAGDFVKEAGGDWIKVLKVVGRNIYLDYDDGLNCLDVDDVIAWKHGT
jgi:hypothetical protein